MSLRDELQSIYDAHGGILTPEIVVEEATPKSSPLHSRFEWNDMIAGAAYRREQARELIGKCKVIYKTSQDGESLTVRAFHAVPAESGTYEFEPVEKIAADPFLRELVLREMERDWKQLQNKYSHMVEFVEMVRKDIAS